jgi:hypothetical protein
MTTGSAERSRSVTATISQRAARRRRGVAAWGSAAAGPRPGPRGCPGRRTPADPRMSSCASLRRPGFRQVGVPIADSYKSKNAIAK